MLLLLLTGCQTRQPVQEDSAAETVDLPASETMDTAEKVETIEVVGSMPLEYAEQFHVDYLTGDLALITIGGSDQYLLVPEGGTVPQSLDEDIVVLQQPLENIYLAATSAMCLFDSLDGLGNVSMSGTRAEGWHIESARLAMENGDIVYAGKYSAPDYELLMQKECSLAVESTMLYHAPEVSEKLENIGIPVLVERSSYESHPLGRTEWIKLYGLLLGKSELADARFSEQAAYLETPAENTGKTVAFFYISSSGSVVARKSNDYAVRMIELAGGTYVFDDLGDSSSATGSAMLEMESFYAGAHDADIIIYNSSVDGEVHTLEQLLGKSGLLADFEAVKNGQVWCTGKNLFQETTEFGLMISEMNSIFTDSVTEELKFFYKLR